MGALRPDAVEYMLQVARTAPAIAYKSHVLAELALEPGLVVVDVGCGPGTDLPAVARLVAPTGLAVGVDMERKMLSAASRWPCSAALLEGNALRLPLKSASVDRVRTDRALQHMRDSRVVLAELHRVLRPAGRAVIAEPDWRTLVIDAERRDVSERFVEYTCNEVVRNAVIGREVARLGGEAGFVTTNVVAFPAVLRDFATADKILGLTRNARAAVDAGYFDSADADGWLTELSTGPALAAVTLFVTSLSKSDD